MNYYNNRLPSALEIQQFRLKRLSVSEMEWMNHLVQTNPMVAAAVSVSDEVSFSDVTSVSNSVSTKILNTYLSKVGFWANYGSWISLSSIVLLIGLATFLMMQNSVVPQYAQNKFDFSSPQKSSAAVTILDEKTEETVVEISKVTEIEEAELVEEIDKKISNFLQQNENIKVDEITTEVKVTTYPLEVPEKSSTRTAGNNVQVITDKTVIVSNVSLLAKLNPDEYKVTRASNSGADPLNSSTSRTGNKQFSMADLPSYPGGDQALMDYFKGKLTPVKTYSNVKYDKAVMLKLIINSRGKVKEYKILGNPHPDHKGQLEQAISTLPKFNSGKGNKVEYNLGLSFN